MKKSLLSGVSFMALALAGGAHAADLGRQPVYKAPALAPAPWSWEGFYVGANVGIASAHSNVADGVNAFFGGNNFDANKTGVIGGVQAGYNWQFNNLVVGLEGDISFASVNRNVPIVAAGAGDTYSSRLDALGTLRGRIGWAFDRTLVYATGGVAWASLKDSFNDPVTFGFTAAPSSSVVGWTLGGGVEYAIANHWTVKAEYLHVGFPSRGSSVVAGAPYTFSFKDSLDIGRVGINYKF